MMIQVPNPYRSGNFTTERVLNFDGLSGYVYVTSDEGTERWNIEDCKAV